ncbi:MAG: hypothetical protein IJ092_07050 [Atopobiaceae bacterium]|nr:hypothetical protein [Atopobiaceae bacterium]
MPTYSKETALYDTGAIASDIGDAATTATNYIAMDSSGVRVANANPATATTYLRLASTFLEFVRGNTSMLKAWVESSVAKIRVGAETGFNMLTDDEGVKLRSGTTVLSQFASDIIELGSDTYDSRVSFCGGAGYIRAVGDSLSINSETPSMTGATESFDGTESTASIGTGIENSIEYVELYASSQDYGSSIGVDLYPTGGLYAVPTVRLTADSITRAFPMSSVINAIPVTLYDNASAAASAAATLSETAANFKRLTIMYRDGDGTHGSVDVWSPNGKRVALSLTWINGASTQEMYQRVRWVTISGTSIATARFSGDTKYRTGQVKLGATASVTNSDYISIVHVIGYR